MHKLHRTVIGRINGWVANHHLATIILVVVGLLIATGLTVFVVLFQSPKQVAAPKANAVVAPAKTPAPTVYYSPLTGEVVPDQASTQLPVTGVMIENSPDARPQSGLKQAGVVYEAIAEGGITRFLALYQQEKPQLIGPVRSLRIYDIDWLAPFQASIAHVGGSLYAVQQIRDGNYRDLDQFFNGSFFWRATDRYAPHNVYTSFANLDKLNQERGYSTSVFTAWPRQDGKSAKVITAQSINVTISSALYNSRYIYNATTDNYTRYQAGAVHMDREDGPITPSTVIVMDVQESTVLQDGYREQITTIGSGKAFIFQNGTEQDATWTKTDSGSQTKFTDAAGNEIPLNRGQTWIAAVPANEGGGVTWQATN